MSGLSMPGESMPGGEAPVSVPPSLRARYGVQTPPAAGPWNSTLELLLDHRTVRKYLSDPLPQGTLETLIAAAQSAATSSNMQSWSVVAVTDAARKSDLAELSGRQDFIRRCPLLLCFIADLSRAQRVAERNGFTLNCLDSVEAYTVAATDAALAAQNVVIAAESLGLATCYIGALRNDPEAVAERLRLPRRAIALFGLCIGYADPGVAVQVKPRLTQAAVLHREVYDEANETLDIAGYDGALRAFGADFRRSVKSWAQRVEARWGELKHLDGRERLREVLSKFGFPLA